MNQQISNNSNKKEAQNSGLPIKKKIWKVYVVLTFIIIGFLMVLIKLFKIQIIDYNYYKAKATQQHESKVILKAQRGNIYDRNGRVIASTISRFSFAIDPKVLTNKDVIDSIANSVAKITNEENTNIINKIKNSKSSFLWLVRNVKGTDALELLKYEEHNGFIINKEPARNYAFGDAASQTIGITNIDNKGLLGIELEFDSILQGTDGYAIMNRDALGRLRPMADLPRVEPKHGNSIQLTIDIIIQRIVEYELKQGVINSGAESGTIVAIAPQTGEIMAIASYPNFNPNDIKITNPNSMKNRAIGDIYEPGSTFKIITAAAAIEEDIIHPNDMVDGLNGTLHYKDYTIVDDHSIGRVTFKEAFAKSSNIVLSNLALRLPENKFYKYIRDFGIGINTNIELPGEVSGKLKTADKFDASSRMFAGYGYGIALTPLQLCMVYATVANTGTLNKPFIVKNIFNSAGDKIKENEPQKIRNVISNQSSKILTNLLVNVVEDGTGKNAKINGMNVAGKTGTAQQLVDGSYKNKKYTASFAGFFPADNPKLAMVVILDKPKDNYYGGSVAAPIFKNIAQKWVSIQPNIILNDKNKNDFQFADSIIVPNFKGMSLNDAYYLMKIYGLTPDIKDSNSKKVILRQDPAAGRKIHKNNRIYFGFENKDKDPKLLTAEELYPNLIGFSSRRAINVLHNRGIKVIVKGNGKVMQQTWSQDKKTCTIILKK